MSTAVDRAYLGIKHRIVQGLDPPGSPLLEGALARRLSASRTPVREALTRLLEEGYVEKLPGRGFFVARVTMTLIRDLFEVRRLLESAAAGRAAELADATAIQQLRELAAVEPRPGDPASFLKVAEANTQFHVGVALASRNAIFVDMVRHCLDQVARLIALGLDSAALQATARAEHEAVAETIARRDPAAARAAMERHLDHCSERMMEGLVRGEVRALTV
jgi:DNA-binding GntR family transcriptional regulator